MGVNPARNQFADAPGDSGDEDDSDITAIRGPPGDLPDLTTCF